MGLERVESGGAGGVGVKKTALVTGCTGYIASHVVKALVDEGGYIIRGTVRRAGDSRALQDFLKLESFDEVVCDLTSEAGWVEAMRGVHIVFHVAR